MVYKYPGHSPFWPSPRMSTMRPPACDDRGDALRSGAAHEQFRAAIGRSRICGFACLGQPRTEPLGQGNRSASDCDRNACDVTAATLEPRDSFLDHVQLQDVPPAPRRRSDPESNGGRLAGCEIARQRPSAVVGDDATPAPVGPVIGEMHFQPAVGFSRRRPRRRAFVGHEHGDHEIDVPLGRRRNVERLQSGAERVVGQRPMRPRGRGPAQSALFVRQLKHGEAVGMQHADEFADVPLEQLRREVLEDDVGVNQIEAFVFEEGQVVGGVYMIVAAVSVPVERAGTIDHRRRDVHAVARFIVLAERLRQASDAAAEIERAPARRARHHRVDPRHQPANLLDAGCEKLSGGPAAVAPGRIAEDCPERIVLPERIPLTLEGFEIHVTHRASTRAR